LPTNEKWDVYLKEYAAPQGRAPAFRTETMGCQMNERDSETIAGLLEEMGYVPAASRQEAAVIVVNTCSVREIADPRVFGILGQIKKVKEAHPALVTAVCGCMMQQQHVVDAVKSKYPWVDIIFGTHNIHMLPELLRNVVLEKHKATDVWDDGGEIVEGLPARRTFAFKAYINVMYGCDNYCSYCIVPYTRGRERSRATGEILREARALADSGAKEVMLLGQNVNSYRGAEDAQTAGFVDFPALLYRLAAVPGLERIRFMTSHPKDLSDRLIAAFRDCKKLCKVIHLPVQSGSSRTLARMNRRYTKEHYIALIEKLRDASPGIAVTTDIITGFPGETGADFEETLDLAEKIRFDSAFTFLYSARKGTPAAQFGDQVPEEEKHRRFNLLVERLNGITAEKNNAYLGRTERVLAEGRGKTGRDTLAGRTDSGKLVNFIGPLSLTGQMVDVRITGAKTFSLYGEIAARP
jgi:tRNA-2-methylthio-N6-dimethylallyladenosine synthase